MKELDNDEKDL